MADAYTDFLNLTKPEVGGSRDAWGAKWNTNADAISVWAKATDALVKRAVLTDPANQAAQTIGGPLNLSGDLLMAKAKAIRFQEGSVNEAFTDNTATTVASLDVVAPKSNVLRVVNNAYNMEMLRLDAAGAGGAGYAAVFGKSLWHTGNLTLANLADKTVAAEQSFVGPLVVNRAYPRISFIYPNVRTFAWGARDDGHLYAEDLTANGLVFSVRNNGDLWSKTLGDIGTRIDTRAAAFADDRLAIARSEYVNNAKTTGAYFTGDVGFKAACFIDGIGGRFPTFRLYNSTYGNRTIDVDNGGNIRFVNTDGNNRQNFGPDGSIWTFQIGDLNSRIEARGAAFADDRLATARSEYNQKVPLSGGNMSGDLQVIKNYPTIHFLYPSIRDYGWQVREDGRMYLWDYTANRYSLSIGTVGDIYTQSFGDVSSRIETRAQAFADDRLATATARINNKSARLSFATDVTIGDVGNSALWEGTPGGVITGFQQNGTTGQARLFRVRQLQMSDSNGSWYACGYV